ncbi:hypothetical protein Q4485_10910 [Granulosicoccaceae sp. 1_MG-2023]|nr:hypothetical protein [Granulosicoccaceae sp. 1_MG-2023]
MLNRIEVLLDRARSPVFCYDRTRYFLDALERYSDARFRYRPLSAEFMAPLRAMNVRGAHGVWERIGRLTEDNLQLSEASNHIGQFHFVFDDVTVNVAIDTADGRSLHDQSILDWSDVYFKCNYWPDLSYPDKVLPLINANGTLSPAKVRHLRGLRGHRKDYDLIYWSRIWASPGSVADNNGVEHNIRMFETLAKAPGNNNLLAVFPNDLTDNSLDCYRKRLDVAGVRWQNGWGPIKSADLWNSLAAARLNFLRPGNHLCVSWRMMDLLCMGAGIIVDGAPYAEWPEPLRDQINFIDGGCTLDPDYNLPEDSTYDRLLERVAAAVENPDLINSLSTNNAEYFDQYAAMPKLAGYIINAVAERCTKVSVSSSLIAV